LNILKAAFIGLISGVIGTGLGGILSSFFNLSNQKTLSFLLAASAGLMISVSLVELIPEAIETAGKFTAGTGFGAGIIVLFILDMLLPHMHREHDEKGIARLKTIGILIGIGIALHNFPEGFAIGAAYVHETGLGVGIAVLIALHNVPEGMAMAVPLRAGQVPAFTVIFATLVAGLPMALGSIAGAIFGSISPQILSTSLGFAAGAMMYVVSDELIPDAHMYDVGHSPTIGLVIGIFAGLIISFSM
jgi:ZIP family zinc transporter